MASSASNRQFAEALLATAATAALFYFGNGLEPLWPLVWFAPLPILLFALRSRWPATSAAAIAAILLGNLNLWSYLTKSLGASGVAWLGIFLPVAIVFAVGVLLFRALVLRGALWSGLIALPSIFVTGEYLRNLTSPHGTAGSLAYSQLKFLPFLQLASVTGPWGVTFVLLLFPAAIAIALHLRQTAPRRALQVAGAGVGIVAAVLIFGAVRLALPLPQTLTVKVGLIASDQKANVRTAQPGAATAQLFSDYAHVAETLTAQGAQAIVIPEKVGETVDGSAAATNAVLQSLADRTGATVVAGVVDVDGPIKYNQARIYLPNAPMRRYDKEHMLPPFESYLTPGTALVTLSRPRQKWGVAICKDMDFASPARSYGKADIGLMLVPAWDFVVDRAWHGHIAIMRGVEDGFSIARAAKNGFLTASDNRGRILGEVRSNSAPFATLLVDLPAAHSWTVYRWLGDWFAWVAMALLLFAIVQCARLRGRVASQP